MKLIIISLITLLFLLCNQRINAHNEFYKNDNGNLGLTNNPSEAIKWHSYINLPILLRFTASKMPGTELGDSTNCIDDFRSAFGQWADIENTTVSFTEEDPDPNTDNDQIYVDFSTDAEDFVNPQYDGANAIVIDRIDIDDKYYWYVTTLNGQTCEKILFNSSNAKVFQWSRQAGVAGYCNFTHCSLHELGHILGLNHCTAPNYPVMKETYEWWSQIPRVFLQDPDIIGLQTLLGQGPISKLKLEPFLNRDHYFFNYDPKVLSYINNDAISQGKANKSNLPKSKENKLFTTPKPEAYLGEIKKEENK